MIDWLWYLVTALYVMRESSKAFQDVVRDMYVACEWTLLQTVPCLAYNSRLDALSGWHGDDFYTEGATLDEVDAMILGTFTAKVLPRLGCRTLKQMSIGSYLSNVMKNIERIYNHWINFMIDIFLLDERYRSSDRYISKSILDRQTNLKREH